MNDILFYLILAAILVIVGIIAVKGRAALAGKGAEDQQKKDNTETQKQLDAVGAVKIAQLEAAEAKKALAEKEVTDAHVQRVQAIDKAAATDAAELAAQPDTLPDSLVGSLKSANRKLNGSS
jgi:hypothetical protein